MQQTTWLVRSAKIPLIVDADTGFGEAVNVERTVTELVAAGAAAIQLEDQRLPKRGAGTCPARRWLSQPRCVPRSARAVSARGTADTIILARTDARGVHGIEASRSIVRKRFLDGRRRLGYSLRRSGRPPNSSKWPRL